MGPWYDLRTLDFIFVNSYISLSVSKFNQIIKTLSYTVLKSLLYSFFLGILLGI